MRQTEVKSSIHRICKDPHYKLLAEATQVRLYNELRSKDDATHTRAEADFEELKAKGVTAQHFTVIDRVSDPKVLSHVLSAAERFRSKGGSRRNTPRRVPSARTLVNA